MNKTRHSAAEKRRFEFLHDVGICACPVRHPSDLCPPGPVEVAHIRAGIQSRVWRKVNPGMGGYPHHVWTVPLCPGHHHEQHQNGERKWWESKGIDWDHPIFSPLGLAVMLQGFCELDEADSARDFIHYWRMAAIGRTP